MYVWELEEESKIEGRKEVQGWLKRNTAFKHVIIVLRNIYIQNLVFISFCKYSIITSVRNEPYCDVTIPFC